MWPKMLKTWRTQAWHYFDLMWGKQFKWKLTFEMIRNTEQVLLRWQWPHNKSQSRVVNSASVQLVHTDSLAPKMARSKNQCSALSFYCIVTQTTIIFKLPCHILSHLRSFIGVSMVLVKWLEYALWGLTVVSPQSRWCKVISDLHT